MGDVGGGVKPVVPGGGDREAEVTTGTGDGEVVVVLEDEHAANSRDPITATDP
jgi:hypothetical protein